MKKVKKMIKDKPEFAWIIGELIVIATTWSITENFFIILGIKLLSMYASEELFHEEISGRFKRLSWQMLVFLAFASSFTLNHTGFKAYGFSLTIFIAMAGFYLLQVGVFHKDFPEEEMN